MAATIHAQAKFLNEFRMVVPPEPEFLHVVPKRGEMVSLTWPAEWLP
jgi:hypothetical protein